MDLINMQFGQMLHDLSRPTRRQQATKCDLAAERARKEGNTMFQNRKFEESIELYNESLRYAPAGSEGIALAYGNRSAAYFEMGQYVLALENIELARKSGFPTNKKSQLDAREVKCRELMKQSGSEGRSDVSSFFKLSHPPNEKIPFIAGCLELRRNVKYGRHIVTTKDLKTGDIIAIEPPAIAFTNEMVSGASCFHCTKSKSGSLIPCFHCTTAMFCSEECQQKATLYHLKVKRLSDAFRALFESSFKMHLEAFRVAGGVDEALELLQHSEDKTIFDFDFSNPNDPNYEKSMLIALNGLCRHAASSKISMEFFLDMPPISEKPRTDVQRRKLLKFLVTQYKICSSNKVVFQNAHHGIFPFKQLLNHSCIPDVECTKVGNEIVMIVNHPIKAGKQIFASYGVYAADHPKKERALFLQDQRVKCECMACVNKIPAPFPRKDHRFVEPNFTKVAPEVAIAQFRKNCQYVDQNAGLVPCYEVAKLLEHNLFLVRTIAGQ